MVCLTRCSYCGRESLDHQPCNNRKCIESRISSAASAQRVKTETEIYEEMLEKNLLNEAGESIIKRRLEKLATA